MITPSYSLTATERVLPRLALDFTTAVLDPRVTFTRSGNTATVIDSNGVIVGVNANIPRFDFDPVTLVCRGLLIEESRTNELLNSLINGTNLSTQSVTVTATPKTLSFYGTGQIVLSGAASATVTGTGAYPARTILTFTPSAGVLTLTVTGTVQFAQLEAGAFATSYIPTAASQVTRNADVATMTGTNFSDWYNATEGAFILDGYVNKPQTSTMFILGNGSINRYIYDSNFGAAVNEYRSYDGANISSPRQAAIGFNKVASAYKSATSNKAVCVNGGSVASGAYNGAWSTNTALSIFETRSSGWVKSLSYYPQRLTDAELQAFTK